MGTGRRGHSWVQGWPPVDSELGHGEGRLMGRHLGSNDQTCWGLIVNGGGSIGKNSSQTQRDSRAGKLVGNADVWDIGLGGGRTQDASTLSSSKGDSGGNSRAEPVLMGVEDRDVKRGWWAGAEFAVLVKSLYGAAHWVSSWMTWLYTGQKWGSR